MKPKIQINIAITRSRNGKRRRRWRIWNCRLHHRWRSNGREWNSRQNIRISNGRSRVRSEHAVTVWRRRMNVEVIKSNLGGSVLSIFRGPAKDRSRKNLTVHINGGGEAEHVAGAIFGGGILRQLPPPPLAELLQFTLIHFLRFKQE